MQAQIGEIVQIHSYKHNHRLHRVWKKALVLQENSEFLLTCNSKTRVIESNGRNWVSREPALFIFYKESWFNVIAMLKSDGVHYYCNLSSPYIYDGEAIKYIDYDLDVKVFPDHSFHILDRDEYNQHRKKMSYPSKVQAIIEEQLNRLIEMIKQRQEPFNDDYIENWYNVYQKIKRNN